MKRPSPAMAVAIVALIAALAGSALALPGRNSVKSNDIAPRNVRGSDLAPRAVTPPKTDLVRSAVRPGLAQTISNSATALDGPVVTVNVPSGSLVAIHAQADIRRAGGAGTDEAAVHLHEAVVLPNAPRILGTASAATETRYTTPGQNSANGIVGRVRSGWLVLSNVPPGRRTFSLRYSSEGGTGLFEDRRLQVAVIR